jgi:hypothetical protein
MPATTTSTARRRALLALAADAVFVVLFAAAGRASHDETFSFWGVGMTAWPFVVSLVAGWLASRAWRAPLAPLRTGVPLWIVTVAGGMLLRFAIGEGTALPFVIVATLTLLAMLVGWRLIASWRPRAERPAAPDA